MPSVRAVRIALHVGTGPAPLEDAKVVRVYLAVAVVAARMLGFTSFVLTMMNQPSTRVPA